MIDYEDDFHYATDAEWDQAGAYERGAEDPDRAWILSDRDVWYRNPYYVGPPVPHPEERDDELFDLPGAIDSDYEPPVFDDFRFEG